MRKLLLMLLSIAMLTTQLFAQSRIISGKVKDASGAPISGASVMIRGSRAGTSTANDGSFSLTVPGNAKGLSISAVGYLTQDLVIGSSAEYSINLPNQEKGLQEVVVVGYGTQKKKTVTGAAERIGGAELENRPFSSVDQLFNGKVAGLVAPSTSGQPGANQQVRIRGIGSINAGSNPLYVVDGVILNIGDLSRLTTTSNALAGINPNDIESVTVLKDASATSIYGARGANGVILITTKKGKAGKTKFRADAEIGYNNYANFPDAAKPLRAADWLMLLKEGYVNAGGTQADANTLAASYGEGSGVDTDWFDLITQQGKQQQYNLSASGGDNKTQFYVSGGYFSQDATIIGSNFKRYSALANLKHQANSRLSFSVNLNASNSIQNTPANGGAFANPVLNVQFLRPTQNPFNSDGSLNINRTGNNNFSQLFNSLYLLENDQRKLTTLKLLGNISAEYKILDNLKFTTRYGVDFNTLEEYNFNNPFHGDGRTVSGRGFAYYTRYFNYTWTNQLDYRIFVDKKKELVVDAKVGYEAQKSKGYFINARADGFPPTTELPLSTNAATVVDGKASATDYSFSAVFGNVAINYKDKYILSGSVRRDGSSRFSDNNKYGTFWSIGGAWNVDQESFVEDFTSLTQLKIRASYGLTGNADIGNYAWRQTVGYGFNYNSQPGGAFNNIGNDQLTWETNKQFDIGFDIGFFKNKLTLTADYYNRVSDDLLFNEPLSRTTGFTSITKNIGKMENKGFELTLNATPVKTRSFQWDISFNITRNKNKILTLPGGNDIIDGTFILRQGYDYRSYYSRGWAGVDPANGDPLWYTDSTQKATTNSYTAAKRYIQGKSASPSYYGGFSNTFNFKGFGITADFIYNFGNYINDGWIFYLIDGVNPTFGKYAKTLERWTKPGDITDVPKYVYGSGNSSSSFSSRFLNKGDYIRLRNITLGYTIQDNLLKKLKLNSANFYVRGTNFFTKTYDKNLTTDPEAGINGQTNLDILYTRSLTVGINLGF